MVLKFTDEVIIRGVYNDLEGKQMKAYDAISRLQERMSGSSEVTLEKLSGTSHRGTIKNLRRWMGAESVGQLVKTPSTIRLFKDWKR